MHEIFKQKNLPYLDIQECPNCHNNIPAYCKVCPECNYDLTSLEAKNEEVNIQDQSSEEKKVTLCPNCKQEVDTDKDFCGHCGFKIKAEVCSCCGELIPSNLLFCPNCGNKKGSQAAPSAYQNLNYQEEKAEVVVKEEVKEEPKIDIPQEISEEKTDEQPKKDKSIEIKARKYLSKKRLYALFLLIIIVALGAVILLSNYIGIEAIVYENNVYTAESSFTGLDLIKTIINDQGINPSHYILNFSFNDSSYELYIMTSGWPTIIAEYMPYAIIGLYGIVLFFLVIAFLANFFGMFSKKRFKTKAIGTVLFFYAIFNIVSVAHMLFLYLCGACQWTWFNSMNLIAFAGFLLIWVITKIIFMKNNKDLDLLRYLIAKKTDD